MKGEERKEGKEEEKKQGPVSQVPFQGCTRAQTTPGKAASANPRH